MKEKHKNVIFSALKVMPMVICVAFMCIYLFFGEDITVDDLVNFAPEKPLYAALFLILLYAFKSLTVFFPIAVLNVLGGFLFEPPTAIIINCIGVVIELTIPYWIGRVSGRSFVVKLENKHPKIAKLFGEHSENSFFLSFFLRALFCLPGDAISMYFGAIKMPFHRYILGSFLGILPGTIAFTLLGMSITDPQSPLFWVSIAMTVGVSVISAICYWSWKKHKKM